MSKEKAPTWLRIADIVIGLITVILSALVLMYPELAVLTMIFVLSITLLVIGVARIFGGVFTEYLSDGTRVTNVVVGVSATVLGAIALGYPDLTTQVLIYILSLALLLTGIARIVIGGLAKALPRWLRIAFISVGVFTAALSASVFLSLGFGFRVLVLMLSFTFLFNGMLRIVQGVTGGKETEQ